MKLNGTPRIPSADRELQNELKQHATQVNLLTEGKISAYYGAMTAAPTTGTHAQGDFVRNSAPAELGMSLTKYVIEGWTCVSSGTPGTWVEKRFLTGN